MGITEHVSPQENVCHCVVRTVAEMDDTTPAEMEPPLYDVIDPEALNMLFRSEPSPHDLSRDIGFVYDDYQIRISGDRAGGVRTVTVRNGSNGV